MTDYPAAHSMDTLWFGVDPDGHVAVFNTGEAGAVPEEWDPSRDPYEMSEDLANALPRRPYRFDRRGAEAAMKSMAMPEGEPLSAGGFAPALLYLRAASPVVQQAIDGGVLKEVLATDGVAVHAQEPPSPQLLSAIDEVLVAIDPYFAREDDDDDPMRQLAARGFFSYEMPYDNWICGPFARMTVPDEPLRVEQIPDRLRKAMNPVALPQRLSDLVLYHPAEHGAFETWEIAWLGTDLETVRPVPGAEDRYAEAYADQDPGYRHHWLQPEDFVVRLETGLRRLLDDELEFLIVEERNDSDHFVQFGSGTMLVVDCPTAALGPQHADRVAAVYRGWGVTAPVVQGTGDDAFDIWQCDVQTNIPRAAAMALELMHTVFGVDVDALKILTDES